MTITIENVEEQGTVTLSSDTGTIQARVPVTATLADDDRPTGVVMWQWWRSPNGRTDWVNIATATSATFDTDGRRRGQLHTRYGVVHGRRGFWQDGRKGVAAGGGRAAGELGAGVPDDGDRAARGGGGRRERQRRGAVEATDFNNDTLYYSLSGTDADAASFTIDSGTGQLRVAQGVTLDYEGKRSYRVTVEVTDGSGPARGDDDMDAIDDRQSVTVTVTNVNEAPVVTGDETASFEENKSSAVASYTGTDPERDTLTWTVSGSDFWISERGQLYFRTPPSYEGGRTSYTVTVTAADDDGLTGTRCP